MIFFSAFCASALFGSVTESTPFLKLASILSASTPSGTCKGALERAEAALAHIIILFLLLFLFLLLALDGEVAVGDLHLDVLLIHAGQFGGDLIGLVGLRDVHRRQRCICRPTAPERCDIEEGATERRSPQAPAEILEQAIDFAAQALERLPRLQRRGRLSDFTGSLLVVSAMTYPPL